MIPVLLTGCVPGDWKITIHNGTSQAWFIRVNRGVPDEPWNQWVVRVDPGADGSAVAWRGAREATVEVLRTDCSLAGIFHAADGETYVVDGIPGLDGRIEAMPFGIKRDGIHDSEECGGFLYR